jgi:AraC-like DNA-binding protein
MLYLSYIPRAPLNQFVERLWLVSEGQSPRREYILPSGTVELVVNLRDDRVRIEGTVHGARGRTLSSVAVSGTYTGAFIIDARQHAAMMGVHFRPGGAFVVLGVPCSELADAHVDLAAIWGETSVRELRERLCCAPTDRARFEYLETELMQRLRRGWRQHPVVPFALQCFTSRGVGASVQEVARRFGLSHRRLLTVFTTEVGVPPKQFCRILRFRHVHAIAEQAGHIDWAQLALACGFFDQSHLANEFRKLSGLTPTEYQRHIRQRQNLLSGHIAVS